MATAKWSAAFEVLRLANSEFVIARGARGDGCGASRMRQHGILHTHHGCSMECLNSIFAGRQTVGSWLSGGMYRK
jgi:hypothetical protein